MAIRNVRCPQCGAVTEYRPENPHRPFCSERCKLIDLGAWAEERYAIPGAGMPAESPESGGLEGAQDPAGKSIKHLDS